MKKKYKKEETFWGILLILPTLIGLIVLNILPAFETVLLSFKSSKGFGVTEWAGMKNYFRLISDYEVWQALINTIKYAVFVVPLVVVISLIVATLLNEKIKGLSFYRVIFYLPVIATPAAVAMIFRWLFNSDYGIMNHILKTIGIAGPKWLSDPEIAIYTIIIVGVWSSIGHNMILLLAGLQEIPKDYYESASLDGAGWFKQFYSITLPLITPSLFFVVVTTVINSLQVFDVILLMFEKNSVVIPKTQSLVYLFYKHSFEFNDKGYGSLIALLLLMIILLITWIQMKVQKKWVHY